MTKKEKNELVEMYRKAVFNYSTANENDLNYKQGRENALWEVLYYIGHMSEEELYLIANKAETDAFRR